MFCSLPSYESYDAGSDATGQYSLAQTQFFHGSLPSVDCNLVAGRFNEYTLDYRLPTGISEVIGSWRFARTTQLLAFGAAFAEAQSLDVFVVTFPRPGYGRACFTQSWGVLVVLPTESTGPNLNSTSMAYHANPLPYAGAKSV